MTNPPLHQKALSDLQCVLHSEMQRMTFVWTIHQFSTIRDLAKKRVLPSNDSNNYFLPTPKHQFGTSRWWLEIIPHVNNYFFNRSDYNIYQYGVLLNLCYDEYSMDPGEILGCLFVAETSDGIEIPGSRQQKKKNELQSGFSENRNFQIGYLHKDRYSFFVDSEDRLNLRCVVEFGSFVNGENSSSRIPKLEPSLTLPFPLDLKLSKQVKISYTTET
eukprot:GHVP01036850.1.p1 GENE.GHVP01036850.1~~GHVP01036850.1.p1  ORF type:complete len:217 (+),score=30.75 GHVP01036850.1:28-678(+)